MKESIYRIKKDSVFSETFTDEAGVRANNGVPVAVTFSNGVASFNGSSSYINFTKNLSFTGSISIRFKRVSGGTDDMIVDFRKNSGTGYVYISTAGAVQKSSGTTYIDGVVTSTYPTDGQYHTVTITGMAINAPTNIYVGSGYGLGDYSAIDIEFTEIYNYTLTANEVKNLYENKRNINPLLNRVVNVIANPNFSTDTVWGKGTGWTISNGKATHAAGSASTISQPITFPAVQAGLKYSTKFVVSDCTAGSVYIQISGGGGGTGTSRTANGTYYEDINAGTTSPGNFYIIASADFNGSVSSVYINSITQEILNIDARNGVIANKYGTAIVNTAVTAKRAGSIYAIDFKQSSKLDCGSYETLVGDKTFITWIKLPYVNANSLGRIFDNSKFYWYQRFVSASEVYLTLVSDGATYINTAINPFTYGQWQMMVATRTSTGVTNFYVDGVLSGSANQSSGTPVAGTSNLIVGNLASGTNRQLTGQLSNTRIVNGILSIQEISNLFESERKFYQS